MGSINNESKMSCDVTQSSAVHIDTAAYPGLQITHSSSYEYD